MGIEAFPKIVYELYRLGGVLRSVTDVPIAINLIRRRNNLNEANPVTLESLKELEFRLTGEANDKIEGAT